LAASGGLATGCIVAGGVDASANATVEIKEAAANAEAERISAFMVLFPWEVSLSLKDRRL